MQIDTNKDNVSDIIISGDEIRNANENISIINGKLGATDIKSIGDGTITGAIDTLNSKSSQIDITVNGKGELVFTNSTGADTVIPFKNKGTVRGVMSIIHFPAANRSTGEMKIYINDKLVITRSLAVDYNFPNQWHETSGSANFNL